MRSSDCKSFTGNELFEIVRQWAVSDLSRMSDTCVDVPQ